MITIIDKDCSSAIKLICALLVLIGHILLYADSETLRDLSLLPPFDYFLGTIWVGVFLFLSGQGLILSLLTKDDYLSNFLLRIKNIIYPFLFVSIIYNCIALVYRGFAFDLYEMIFQIKIGFTDAILPFSWYIILQFILYVFFYIAFKITNNNRYLGLFMLTFLVLLLIELLRYIKFPMFWNVSIPSFLLGCYWGYFNITNLRIFRGLGSLGVILLLVIMVFSINIPIINYTIITWVIVFFFREILVLLPHVVRNTKIIDSYSIYLVQGFFIVLIKPNNIYSYVILSVFGTLLLSVIIKYICKVLVERSVIL